FKITECAEKTSQRRVDRARRFAEDRFNRANRVALGGQAPGNSCLSLKACVYELVAQRAHTINGYSCAYKIARSTIGRSRGKLNLLASVASGVDIGNVLTGNSQPQLARAQCALPDLKW